MGLKLIYSAMILAAIVLLASCNAHDAAVNTNNQNSNTTPLGPETTYADGVRRITTGELETLIKEGKAYVVDVRLEDAYNMGHIPGSHLIPASEILKHVDKLPRDKMIVTYCSWTNEHTSAGAVVTLKTKGIQNAAALLGGFQLWQTEGRPVDKKKL